MRWGIARWCHCLCQLLQTLVCLPTIANTVRALLNIALRNAFNEATRHTTFDARTGKASRANDNGRAQIGDDIPHLANAQHSSSISRPCTTALAFCATTPIIRDAYIKFEEQPVSIKAIPSKCSALSLLFTLSGGVSRPNTPTLALLPSPMTGCTRHPSVCSPHLG